MNVLPHEVSIVGEEQQTSDDTSLYIKLDHGIGFVSFPLLVSQIRDDTS